MTAVGTPAHRRPPPHAAVAASSLSPGQRALALAAICLSVLVVSVETTIVNVALPTLVRELGATDRELQWIVDSYVLVFAGLLLTAGTLGDRYGRRLVLNVGLVVFAATSAWAALVDTPGELIVARAAMGVGGALIFPATLALITAVFIEPAERARAIGLWAAMSGAAVALGPIAGGALLTSYWWGSIFLVNVPLAAVALAANALLLPRSRDEEAPRLDVVGAVLSASGLALVVYALIEAPEQGWSSPQTLALLGFAVLLLGAFVLWERSHATPLLDVTLFRRPRFSAASGAITVAFFALFGFIFLITQYFQFVLGFSALGTGVRLLPVALSLAVASVTSPLLAARVGSKAVVAGGLLSFAAGIAWASTVSPVTSYAEIACQMVLLGAGIGATTAPATESVMGALSVAKAGVGSAVNDTTRQVGGVLGIAVVGSVYASTYTGRLGGDPLLSLLAAEAAQQASDSFGRALAVAAAAPVEVGAPLAAAATSAFLDGLHRGALVAAGVAVVGALGVLAFLPSRARPQPMRAPAAAEETAPADLSGILSRCPTRAAPRPGRAPSQTPCRWWARGGQSSWSGRSSTGCTASTASPATPAPPGDVLTARLKGLVAAGVLERRQYTERPPRSEYHLTESGLDLGPVLLQLKAWGDRHLAAERHDGPPVVFGHSCGAPFEPTTTCAACDQRLQHGELTLVSAVDEAAAAQPEA